MALNPVERACAALLVDVCTAGADDVALALTAAVEAGATDAQVDELLLLGPLYTGYPRTLNAFAAWRAMRSEVAALPTGSAVAAASRHDGSSASASSAAEDRRAAGRAAFDAVYGTRAERVLEELGRLHPSLRAAILEDAYGRVLSRDVLPLRLKELCAIPVLIATDAPRQLASHVLGARRAGAADEDVLAAAEAARKRTEPGRFAAGLVRVVETLARRD